MDGFTIQHEEAPIWESRAIKNFIRKKYTDTKQALSVLTTYGALCELAGDNSKGMWPIKQIASRACLSYPTCSAAMKELEKSSIIKIEAQRDAKGHQLPSLVTLMTRVSLTQESQTKESAVGDSLDQEITSKGPLQSSSKETVQDKTKSTTAPKGALIHPDQGIFWTKAKETWKQKFSQDLVWPKIKGYPQKLVEALTQYGAAELGRRWENMVLDPWSRPDLVSFVFNPDKWITRREANTGGKGARGFNQPELKDWEPAERGILGRKTE